MDQYDLQQIHESIENIESKVDRRDSEGLNADLLFRLNSIEDDLKSTKEMVSKEIKSLHGTLHDQEEKLKIEIESKISRQATTKAASTGIVHIQI